MADLFHPPNANPKLNFWEARDLLRDLFPEIKDDSLDYSIMGPPCDKLPIPFPYLYLFLWE